MKSLIIKSIALGLITLGLWSCKKEETKVVASSGTPGTLMSSVSTLVLDKEMLNTDVIKLDLTNASFGYQAGITNTLQLAVKGTDFKTPKDIALEANVLSKVFKGMDFNNLLLALNLPFTENSDVELRIKSSISSAVAPVYSNVLTLSARPFPLTTWIYVPGAYQGWNPQTADSLISLTGNGEFKGVIGFTPGNLEFKITPAKKWDIAYGDAGAGKISPTSSDNFKAPAAGAFQLFVDLNKNEIELTPIVFALIGDATPKGWDGDTDMTYEHGVWTVTADLKVGEMKFRQDHKWDVNYGGSGGDAVFNGGNIKVTVAGSYTVTFDVNNLKYTLVKK